MIKRFFAIVVAIFMCIGCCGNSSNDVSVLTFSTWGTSSEIKILKPIISDFEKLHPNVKIELMHIPQDYFKKLHLMFASNLAPDVIFVNNLNLPVYSKFLEPVTFGVSSSDFYKQSIDALSVGGQLYAVPRDVSTLVVYYNKTMFRECNIPYPNEYWTLNDLIKKAVSLKEKGYFGISYEPSLYYVLPYINYMGARVPDSDNIKTYSKEFIGAVSLYKDMAYTNHVAPMLSDLGSRTSTQMFIDKKIGMHLSGRWLVPKYRESLTFDWDVVNFPSYSSPCDASGWAVTKTAKNKAIAKEFVMFLSSKENISKMAQSGLIVPARIDVAESREFLNGKPDSSYIFIDAVKHSKANCVSKNYIKIVDKLTDEIFSKN